MLDLNSLQEKMVFKGHTGSVLCLLYLEKVDLLASGSVDGTVRVWDLSATKAKKVLRGHKKGVYSLAFNDESRVLITCGFDHDALVWNPYR